MGNDQQIEIDLLDLLKKLYKFSIKKKWLLLTSFAIGSIIGVITVKRNPYKFKSYYEKNYTAFSHELPKETISDAIKDLEGNITTSHNDENLTHLSGLLNLSTDLAKDLKGVTVIDNYFDINENGVAKFSIEVFDKENIDSIADRIILYINSSPYIKIKRELTIRQKSEMLSLINKKIHEIDSCALKNNANHLSTSPSVIISKETAELSYVELFEQKQEIEKELQLFQGGLYFVENNSPIAIVNKSFLAGIIIIGYGILACFLIFLVEGILRIGKHFKN